MEVKEAVQGHRAGKQHTCESNPGVKLTLEAVPSPLAGSPQAHSPNRGVYSLRMFCILHIAQSLLTSGGVI